MSAPVRLSSYTWVHARRVRLLEHLRALGDDGLTTSDAAALMGVQPVQARMDLFSLVEVGLVRRDETESPAVYVAKKIKTRPGAVEAK